MRRRETAQTQTQSEPQTQRQPQRVTQTPSRGNWLTRFLATWWRVRLHWKLFKMIVNVVRGLFGRRTPAYRR